ncbi:hypothetical protein [Vibrio hippocampi]|uniref:Uncharacterized protein n=1 Tax=Vibrio hippocampi TaxID=654686 RepID=A0ABN8DPG1_9VIBR|nr:hypothetical protein [Vibrio hippocampi]CAH0530388.1 hypothetical protein VHP8226_04031 [Vibrio hippocampi]
MTYPTFLTNKIKPKHWLASSIAIALLSGCGGSDSGGNNSGGGEGSGDYPIDDSSYFQALSSTPLNANVSDGFDAYETIESVYGTGSIEAPDLYDVNHPTESHIIEFSDIDSGFDYFKFYIHTHEDIDRDKLENDDRQRNEIKVYGNSDDKLKGTLGKIFEYSWKFRVNGDFNLTSNFTHLFQLKAVKHSGSESWVNDSQPILTFTANTKSGVDNLEIRHVHYNSDKSGTTNNALYNSTEDSSVDWNSDIEDQWLEAFVRVDYNEDGKLHVTLTKLGEDTPIITVTEQNLEMWRSGSDANSGNFVRPKWGIYRSISQIELLQDQDVDFADFVIKEVEVIEPETQAPAL